MNYEGRGGSREGKGERRGIVRGQITDVTTEGKISS